MHLIIFFSVGAPLQDLYNVEKETCLWLLGKEMENSYKRDDIDGKGFFFF